MAAVTANQIVTIKEGYNLTALPVASGETIYKGTIVVIGTDGLLYNLDSAAIPGASLIGVVADDSVNASGPAATTSAGSISGSLEETSADAGDKTVRNVWLGGQVKVVASGLAQTSVGKTAYASNNNTVGLNSGVPMGTFVTYLSATSAYVDLNRYSNANGVQVYRGLITAATTTAGGDAINLSLGRTAYVNNIHLDVTTPATGAATMDVGIAATLTSDDTLIDGVDVGTAAIYANATVNGGTNGKAPRKILSTQYITATPSASLAGLVGTFVVEYINA